ncbi:GAF domain-containing sensor histidine kinase [Salinimonas sediminis]|uniref:histidine kinase n=1 Tax=Salinimonas sediminis TaxID=2303538 RepID=A0A346NHF2_9ALTE|nr:ATP-binding protein [Salinimonas sediminis]AXR04959.1 GAF domain-containing protein [Salinimonas sediminis]
MRPSVQQDIHAIQSIEAVPTILSMISESTGLRFVCIARVSPDNWTACAVLDNANFNLLPGDTLEISTTFCEQVRSSQKEVMIDHVEQDNVYHNHPTPKMYGFESYFSYPIYDAQGDFFGTLCGLDPLPMKLKTDTTRSMIASFAQLISRQLSAERRFSEAQQALQEEQAMAQLREQYIAILGHDLRTPLSSIMMGVDVLKLMPLAKDAASVLKRMENSAKRISLLTDNVMDFTHGQMGKGIPIKRVPCANLAEVLKHTVAELESNYHKRTFISNIDVTGVIYCDTGRLAQLLSNLLINALVHGDSSQPVVINAHNRNGQLLIEVANGGQPIPAETQARLFQPFWRNPWQGAHKGLGLGLFIASQIAAAHQGELAVASDEQQTTFTFTAQL